MIFFVYIFCQFSSGALLADIRLIQKHSFYLVEKTGEAQKFCNKLFIPNYSILFLYYWNMIFLFYNFCQFSSGALLVDIRLIQNQSFYLVEKTGEARKILQYIVDSKLFYSFSLLLKMIFFFYNFCQFSSGALLIDIWLIQKHSFCLMEIIGEGPKILPNCIFFKICG